MFERIVVAYDGSDPARAAARLAFTIAHACGAHVLVVHAVELRSGLPAHAELLESLERTLEEQDRVWTRRLQALAELAPAGTRVSPKVAHGRPAGALLDFARAANADLVVAGTHGVGGLKPLLGSVSHQLLEHAPCPVLLVREELPAEGRLNVLVALDGSEPSLRGLDVAQVLAGALSATLRLVHVIDARLPLASAPMTGVVEELRRHGRNVLHEARMTVRAPLDEVVEELREGSSREELVAACAEHGPAIAVVGSRGVGGFRGLLLGSTARHLVSHAACPVLVTRGLSPETTASGRRE